MTNEVGLEFEKDRDELFTEQGYMLYLKSQLSNLLNEARKLPASSKNHAVYSSLYAATGAVTLRCSELHGDILTATRKGATK